MHIVIAFITALASLLYALDRFGVDIGWLNPWAWRRRRRWLKQYHANPAFNLETPMEAVALLLAAVARVDGDISSDEKTELKRIFEDTFKQNPTDASALLVSSVYLLNAGGDVPYRPADILSRSLDRFSDEQRSSTLELLSRVAFLGGGPSPAQREFIDKVHTVLAPTQQSAGWQ